MCVNQNSDFLFGFQASLSNTNGDPDQENKPRMDYETKTALVSDLRRKRDVRDFLKNKRYKIFVDTLEDRKVPMDKMFDKITKEWFNNQELMNEFFESNPYLKEQKKKLFDDQNKKFDYENFKNFKPKGSSDEDKKAKDEDKKAKKEFITNFNNNLLTKIIKDSLIDIRLFGSAMAVEMVTKTYTGPVQISWGYSLHPVEMIKSHSITSIMNEDNSTFGNSYKLYYALITHYGTINKYNAKRTGMTDEDRDIFRKALIQSLMMNQTESKQGQQPLFYLEIVYKPEFDGYIGDLRRFVKVIPSTENVRNIDDLTIDFKDLKEIIDEMSENYIDKVIAWKNPSIKINESKFLNFPEYEGIDLLEPIKPAK